MDNKSTLLADRIFPDDNKFEFEVLNIPETKKSKNSSSIYHTHEGKPIK